ncbi:hypothetical protein F4803DRAFT_509023 [Xylaria telfairii]|nr:hypothetical protein F4803DRAFT_509023 [Xylaria telfairii]
MRLRSLLDNYNCVGRFCIATSIISMEITPIPEEPNSPIPASTSTSETIHCRPSEPGPATGGQLYKENKQRPSVLFEFCPDPTRSFSLRCQDWVAHMEVKCFDVPRLMREGFHWDTSNVIKEEGYIQYGKDCPNLNSWKTAALRWYFLADTRQPQRWTAAIDVRTWDVDILYNFDLSRLSRQLIKSAAAYSQNQQLIYQYESYALPDTYYNRPERPMVGFNTIYDKMPMEGFWPWPRKENEAHTEAHVDEGAKKKVVSGWSQRCSLQDRVELKENLIDIEVDLNKGK